MNDTLVSSQADTNLLSSSVIDRKRNQTFIHQKQKIFKVNYSFIVLYVLIASLGVVQLGMVLSANNQVSAVFDEQFGLIDQSDKNFYHTMIGSAAVLGAVIGSLCGGKLITVLGRRRSMIIFNIIGAGFIGITMIENFYTLCIGRLLFGFCGGIFQVALPRMIEETVPHNLYGSFGVVSVMSLNFGQMMGIVMGLGLPDADDEESMKNTSFWRIIYGMPWVLQAIVLVSYLIFLKHDTIKYLIDNKKDEEALSMIRQIYHESENHRYILEYLKMTSSSAKGNKVSFKESLFGKYYWRATWFCFIFSILNQLTGCNSIIWYSGAILKRMQNSSSGSTLTPKSGSMLIAVINFLGTIAAIYPIKKFGRKTLVLAGHVIMGTFMILVGLFSFLEYNDLMIAMILCFLFTFQTTDGPVLLIYGPEVTVDQGFGFCVFGIKGTGLLMSLTTEYLMDSGLHPYGTFWLYGGITWAGFFYFLILMKETKNLTDRQKKALYRKDYDPNNIIISP
ncbi:sugar transporter family protein [Stylonychia lemnae]|uniref:Hexose transporter 1 n=1 Tax=Stylonychia lemnae TaxID=5949 RepID=A0A078A8H4_STYLE|nr:sugar transporter family protein [Stylonychia lemnae]|eukprot:CDW78529.1 sugar transporter family protein [Stylonychia lemnae]